MDTAKVLKRQLSYCLRAAETDAQRDQITWWIAHIDRLEVDQPRSETVAAVPVATATTESAAA